MTRESVEAIRKLVNGSERVLVIAHISPDGDAISSLISVGLALRQWKKEFTLVCDDGSPSRFNFLPLSNKIQKNIDARATYDLIISVDCGDLSRMGRAYEDVPEPRPPMINVDHHVTNTRFGEVNLVDSECNSTTEILFHLLPALDVKIDSDLATGLLTGIVTDTLGFRTAGVSAGTFEAASALMAAGADLYHITTEALLLKPMTILRLWQVGLDNMKLEKEGILWASISNGERLAVGHSGSSSGGLVNMMANVDEVCMSAVLVEVEDKVHVGFRCRPPYSVSELALNLGGGGHPLASGCTLEGPLAKAEALVVSMSKDSIRRQQALLAEE